jgi:endonuclease/exonuclease/phosphatase family metal-dependent hydrolase
LIDDTSPDVVILQEWRERFRSESLAGGGWHIHRESGQFLASRYPIRRIDRLGDGSTKEKGSVARYELDTPEGVVTVFSVHLASPREGLGEVAAGDGGLHGIAANSALRWTQSRHLAAAADQIVGPVFLAGDFNTPPHSAIFRRVWGGYEDAFSSAGWGWGYTFQARVSAVRIDHILVGGGGRATRCLVGPDVGSPHRPVLADLAWPVE